MEKLIQWSEYSYDNMLEYLKDSDVYDEWGIIILWYNDDSGIEYNVCKEKYDDEIVDCSAFYPFKNGELDTSLSFHFDVGYGKEWEKEIIQKMTDCINELEKDGYWEV